jgi:ribosomal protein L11 methyltransferase
MSWLELSVQVDQEAVESVSELLARYGYNGGVVVEPAWVAGDEGPEFRYDEARPVTLRTYLPVDEKIEEVRQRIEQALWHLGRMRPVGELQVRSLEEEDWANAWKQHYSILRIGKRSVIVPSWLEYEAQPDDVVLHLDPGMAFGTGLHPTTQMCLALLEDRTTANQRVLDLGTGSGILAVAAAKLGAGPILALDNDPIAVAAAQENIERNGVAAIVTAAEGSLGAAGNAMGHWLSGDFGEGRGQKIENREQPAESLEHGNSKFSVLSSFDLIVANLIAKVLILLANDIAAALAPGGTLISSGIIIDREDEVALALAAAGLTQIERRREGEWIALVHSK